MCLPPWHIASQWQVWANRECSHLNLTDRNVILCGQNTNSRHNLYHHNYPGAEVKEAWGGRGERLMWKQSIFASLTYSHFNPQISIKKGAKYTIEFAVHVYYQLLLPVLCPGPCRDNRIWCWSTHNIFTSIIKAPCLWTWLTMFTSNYKFINFFLLITLFHQAPAVFLVCSQR